LVNIFLYPPQESQELQSSITTIETSDFFLIVLCIFIFVAFFILVSIAVFADNIQDTVDKYTYFFDTNVDYNHHFAFAFSILGMLAAIGCGIALLVDIVKG
jgi:uncharacterized membrane protein YhaH (DUF805 family)